MMNKSLSVIVTFLLSMLVFVDAAFAEAAASGDAYGSIGIAILMGVAVFGGTGAQAKAISSGLEAIGRNPSARGDIQTPMILGLVFVESLVIFALAVAFVKF